MFLQNYKTSKEKEAHILFFLITFSILIRIPIILLFGDRSLENEWGLLVDNLITHGTLALLDLDGFLVPNLWMPPLYAYYLYLLSFFSLDNQNYILLILSTQILLSSISVYIFYKINKNFFSEKLSLYSSMFFSIFPLYLYASSQISSASLAIFLIVFFYYFFLKITKKNNFLYILLFSITAGLLILTRREFIVIIIITSMYLFLFFKKPAKDILLILLISTLTVSPYLIRNYIAFDKIIIHSGFGYNLWKGNNPSSRVEGFAQSEANSLLPATFNNIDEFNNMKLKLENIPKDKFYRINQDKIFVKEAAKNIKGDPTRYLILYLKKIFSYIFFDLNSTQPNYYNPSHYLPILLIAITSSIGIFLSNKKSYHLNYLILIYAFYITVIPIFAVLPRYKLYIIPLQIIFSFIFINFIKEKYFSKK